MSFVIACTECDFSEAYPSEAAMRKDGWSNPYREDESDESDEMLFWTHVGLCPDCQPSLFPTE